MPIEVKIGNIYYLIPIILLFATAVILTPICRKKGFQWTRKFVLWIVWANFALHYVKQIFPAYAWTDFPFCLRQSTPENLCALLITMSPFIVQWGNKYMKDYLVLVGILSALAVFFFPTTAFNNPLDNIDSIIEVTRFYVCHTPLFVVPVLMVSTGMHKFDYKRIPWIAVSFLFVECIIALNELLLWGSGLVQSNWSLWLSRDYRNASLQFGPNSSFDKSLGAIYCLSPWKWVQYADGSVKWCPGSFDGNGTLYFLPVLWMFPLILLIVPVALLITWPLNNRLMKTDALYLKQVRAMKKAEKQARLALKGN